MEEWWSSMEGAGRGSQDRNICPTPIFSINLGWLNSVTQSHYKQIVFQLSYLAQLALS